MKFYYRLGQMLLAVLLSSCSGPTALTPPEQEQIQQPVQVQSVYSQDDVDSELTDSMNQFALKVYTQLYEKSIQESGTAAADQENRFVSPVSLHMNLSILYNGASGQTATQLQKVLQAQELTVQELNQGQQVIQDLLKHSDLDVRMEIAGSLWSRSGFVPEKSFIHALQGSYGASLHSADFSSDQAVQDMNSWVSEATHGGIRQMIRPPLAENTSLVLLNAVYFQGEWTEPFDEQQTSRQSFALDGGGKTIMDMMHRQGQYEYTRQQHFQAVRIPYGQTGNLSLVVALPDEDYDLQKFRQQDLPEFMHWTSEMSRTAGEIGLPRLNLSGEIQLKELLRSMGIQRVFDPQQAELDGISDNMTLYLSKVQQNTMLHIDEKGTEAAAATSAEIAAGAMPQQPFRMIMDRPFFLAITDRTTGLIVFMGELHRPV
ncbi:serpin family protein [Paenibacillus wulumuqiensis]|uniref:serpin family protein n=1 Tax=Paenibacillus wulumuqiensis TaxID=1567107 RepID=UPI000619B4F3|nr:serpin family protein [Paenibacillus wulumuqiensis]